MTAGKEAEEHAQKSLYLPENRTFLATLRAIRKRAGLTQSELGERLGRTQNYVTAAERGVVRLDWLQTRDWCLACSANLVIWATEIELELAGRPASKRKRAK